MPDTAQLTDEAAKLLADLRTALEQGGQFIVDQAPPLAREIVIFGRAYETVVLAIFVGLLAWVARFWFSHGPSFVRFLATEKKQGSYDSVPPGGTWRVVALILHAIAAPVSILLTVCKSRDCLMAWFAPRLYVLEYVMAALRPHGCHG